MYKILHLRPECQKSQCLYAVVVPIEAFYFFPYKEIMGT